MVSSETSFINYTANGVTTVFATSFRFLEDEHLLVSVVEDGVETIMELTTDFTVSGAGDSSGDVTFLVAPANGAIVKILRDIPLTQLVDYINTDDFPADSHENALDKLTMICQQLKYQQDVLLGEIAGGTFRIRNGKIQIKNDDTGLYHNLGIQNVSGFPNFYIGDVGET